MEDYFYVECDRCGIFTDTPAGTAAHDAKCRISCAITSEELQACYVCNFTTARSDVLAHHFRRTGHCCYACTLCASYWSPHARDLHNHKRNDHGLARPRLARRGEQVYDASSSEGRKRLLHPVSPLK